MNNCRHEFPADQGLGRLVAVLLACLMLALIPSCDRAGPALDSAVDPPSLESLRAIVAELEDGRLDILVSPVCGVPSLDALRDGDAVAAGLETLAGLWSGRLGLPVSLRSTRASLDPDHLPQGVDVLVSFLVPGERVPSRLLVPFANAKRNGFTMITYWALASAKSALASDLALWMRQARLGEDFRVGFSAGIAKEGFEGYCEAARVDPLPEASFLGLDAEQLAWLEARRAASGAFRAAIRIREDTYEPLPDGGASGFDYELARAFASSLGLRLELEVKTGIGEFFTLNGIQPADLSSNPAYDFTPDLLQRVDAYVGPFGLTPWRQRLMRMIPLIPSRNQLLGRKGSVVRAAADLDGKRFGVVRDSLQHRELIDRSSKEGIALRFLFMDNDQDVLGYLERSEIDFLLDGSIFFAKHSSRLGDFELLPYASELILAGWGVKREDEALARLIGQFIESAQADGYFDLVFERSFGMPFSDYVAVLSGTTELLDR